MQWTSYLGQPIAIAIYDLEAQCSTLTTRGLLQNVQTLANYQVVSTLAGMGHELAELVVCQFLVQMY